MLRSSFCLALTTLPLSAAGIASALAGDASQSESLAVYPERIVLSTARDRQGIVIQKKLADGSTRDVTATARVAISGPAVARVEGSALVPLADGQAELRVELDGLRAAVPVEVERS